MGVCVSGGCGGGGWAVVQGQWRWIESLRRWGEMCWGGLDRCRCCELLSL